MSHGLPNVGAVVSHQMCLLGLVLYGFSCGGKDPTPVDTAKADSSDSDSDSGETAVDSETGTETHDSSNAAGEFLPIEVDQEQYADAGYEVVTYALNPDADNQYASLLEGYAPTFYIIRPIERVSDEIPTLFWYHGGAIGDDSNTDDEMPQGCGADKVIYNAEKTLESEFLPVTLSTRFQWAMVVPRNDWCDYWLGQGPDDPIDPERHYGYYHVKRVLDFVMSGDAGYSPSDEVYGWGTSAGGGAAIHIAARMGENTFKGIIVDSAPSSMFVYHDSDPEVLEHLFGGAPYDDAGEPTDAYAGYAEASGETLVQDGGFRTPVYVTWNTKDRLLGAQHPNRLIAAVYSRCQSRNKTLGS